jgi:hypothetical protein
VVNKSSVGNPSGLFVTGFNEKGETTIISTKLYPMQELESGSIEVPWATVTSSLETARLILRPLEISDAKEVQVLFPQWEIVRYLASRVPWPYPSDGAYKFYRDVALPAIDRGEEWHWKGLRLNPTG